jgi:FkbM family methyltransferase
MFGMKIKRKEDSHSVPSYSSEGEDLLTERLFYGMLAKPAHEPGVYVDIGAYDPIRASNTNRLYQRGWHGLNIEPNPDQIARFVEFRPRDTTVNIGVAEERGQLLYTQFTEPMLNGFLEDKFVERHVRLGEGQVLSRKCIPVAPAREIISEHFGHEQTIDLLNVDVELLELPVLRSIDFKSFRPKVIVIEIHGPGNQSDWEEMEDPTKAIRGWDIETIGRTPEAEFLRAAGYAFFSRFWHSSIFVDETFIGSRKRRY